MYNPWNLKFTIVLHFNNQNQRIILNFYFLIFSSTYYNVQYKFTSISWFNHKILYFLIFGFSQRVISSIEFFSFLLLMSLLVLLQTRQDRILITSFTSFLETFYFFEYIFSFWYSFDQLQLITDWYYSSLT